MVDALFRADSMTRRLYWPRLRDLLADGKISGPAVHDARIAALCLTHGVQALWTADRDFTRFPGCVPSTR